MDNKTIVPRGTLKSPWVVKDVSDVPKIPNYRDLDKVRELHKVYIAEDLSIVEVGKRFNVCPNRLLEKFRFLGLFVRRQGVRAGKLMKDSVPIKEMYDQYINSNIKVDDLAKKYGISGTYLNQLFKANGLKNKTAIRQNNTPQSRFERNMAFKFSSAI